MAHVQMCIRDSGGPILRNKLFFFGDYLGSRWHVGGNNFASVVPDAMRNGDFSVLLSAVHPIQLYDPENGYAAYTLSLIHI